MIFRAPSMRDAIVIETLTGKTIREIAERLIQAKTFEDFVYRESEMDALFTLADIAITTSRESKNSLPAKGSSMQTLGHVRQLIFDAHDATHDNDVKTACELLERAATMLDGPSPSHR